MYLGEWTSKTEDKDMSGSQSGKTATEGHRPNPEEPNRD